jgi:CRISPR-associated protein Csd2
MVLITSAIWSVLQGNPDEDNARRQDPDTLQGIMTPQCLKYKLRQWLEQHGYALFIKPGGAALEQLIYNVLTDVGIDPSKISAEADDEDADEDNETEGKPKNKGKKSKNRVLRQDEIRDTVRRLCADYADVRWFGAVLTKPVNWPITGPIQMGFSMSVDPVYSQELGITRSAVTRIDDLKLKNRDMGRMSMIPFEVCTTPISIDPFRARATGFTYADHEMLISGLREMYDMTRSTLRSGVCAEKLVIFHHDSPYGNARALKLFRRVQIKSSVPNSRSFKDWTVDVDTTGLNGVSVEVLDL